jgi:beta-glucosidase
MDVFNLKFASRFLWGAASSAHQTEGNNTNSNWWYLENLPTSPLTERSGTAVDSYHRYPEDMRLLAEAGLDSYRFSVEWARIEPAPGEFSEKELWHYREMIETAISYGLTPVVTLHHFTNPLWFSHAGAWRGPDAVDIFGRYVARVASILDDVPWVCTINEPNMIALVGDLFTQPAASPDPDRLDNRSISALSLPAPADDVSLVLTAAHRRAVEILHDRTASKVGWTVSCQAFEAEPENVAVLKEVQWAWEDRFLEVSRADDFVGVQAYTARKVGPSGPLPYDNAGNGETQTGWPNRPDALGTAVRHAWDVTGGTPILVTENGIATNDDRVRVTYIERALSGLADAAADGVDVLGYLYWSALDNYEWGDWDATFGLIEVDRATFFRTPRPSLTYLGSVATAQRLRPVTTTLGRRQV